MSYFVLALSGVRDGSVKQQHQPCERLRPCGSEFWRGSAVAPSSVEFVLLLRRCPHANVCVFILY